MRAIHAEDLERGLPGTPSAGNQVNFFMHDRNSQSILSEYQV